MNCHFFETDFGLTHSHECKIKESKFQTILRSDSVSFMLCQVWKSNEWVEIETFSNLES